MILGVTDRRPRQVAGTAAFTEPGRTEAGLHQRSRPSILWKSSTTKAIAFDFPRPWRLPGAAWQHKGRFLKRAGDELTVMGDVELRAIFAETGQIFSAEICATATIADLSPAALADYRARWSRKAANPRICTVGRQPHV